MFSLLLLVTVYVTCSRYNVVVVVVVYTVHRQTDRQFICTMIVIKVNYSKYVFAHR